MAETKVKYAADVAIAVTAWTTTLLTQESATSAIFDNTSTLYMDVLLGGKIDSATVVGAVVAGDTYDIYIVGQYSDTVTDMTGGIDALFGAASEQVEDTDFVLANMPLLVSVTIELTNPDTDLPQDYHWGPVSVAKVFGGIVPKQFMLMLHNNTGASMGAGNDVNAVGVTFDTV